MTETPAQAWRRCRPFIERALEHQGGGYLISDVQAGVEAGDFQFWAGENCAAVTEILTSPRLKILNFWLLGGSLKELLIMRPHIEAWGRAQGCGRAIGGAIAEKRGWGRALESADYRARWTIYSKELNR